MPKKPRPEPRWRVLKIRGAALQPLGYVYAQDEETAVERAIEQYEIPPALQNRIVARPEP